jgi:hypothetical protein
MSLSIRSLSEDDLESADAILKSAFQSSDSRLVDLHLYRKIQPDGWFLAVQNGTPVYGARPRRATPSARQDLQTDESRSWLSGRTRSLVCRN